MGLSRTDYSNSKDQGSLQAKPAHTPVQHRSLESGPACTSTITATCREQCQPCSWSQLCPCDSRPWRQLLTRCTLAVQAPSAVQPPRSPQGSALPPAPLTSRPGLTPTNTPQAPPTVQIQTRTPSLPTHPQAAAMHPNNAQQPAPHQPRVSVRTAEAVPAVKRTKKRARPENHASEQACAPACWPGSDSALPDRAQ